LTRRREGGRETFIDNFAMRFGNNADDRSECLTDNQQELEKALSRSSFLHFKIDLPLLLEAVDDDRSQPREHFAESESCFLATKKFSRFTASRSADRRQNGFFHKSSPADSKRLRTVIELGRDRNAGLPRADKHAAIEFREQIARRSDAEF
jgi:hypothetical protein